MYKLQFYLCFYLNSWALSRVYNYNRNYNRSAKCRMTNKGPMKGTLRILGVLDILDLHCQTIPVFFVFITRDGREGSLITGEAQCRHSELPNDKVAFGRGARSTRRLVEFHATSRAACRWHDDGYFRSIEINLSDERRNFFVAFPNPAAPARVPKSKGTAATWRGCVRHVASSPLSRTWR